MKRNWENCKSDDSSDEETHNIIHASRCKFIDCIGGLGYGVAMKDIIVVSDRRDTKHSYPIHKSWIKIKDGTVVIPFGKVPAKDLDSFYKQLIISSVVINTSQYPFRNQNYKIIWRVYPLKCVHYDCDSIEEAEAWISENGKCAADIATLSSISNKNERSSLSSITNNNEQIPKKSKVSKDSESKGNDTSESVVHKNSDIDDFSIGDISLSVHEGTTSQVSYVNDDTNKEVFTNLERLTHEKPAVHGDTTSQKSHVVNDDIYEEMPANDTPTRRLSNDTLAGRLSNNTVVRKLFNDLSPVTVRATAAQQSFENKILNTLSRLCCITGELNDNIFELRKLLSDKTITSPTESEIVETPVNQNESQRIRSSTPLKQRYMKLLKFPIRSLEELNLFNSKLTSDETASVDRETMRSFMNEFVHGEEFELGEMINLVVAKALPISFTDFQKTNLYCFIKDTITSYNNLTNILPPAGAKREKWATLKKETKIHDIIYRRLRSLEQREYRKKKGKKNQRRRRSDGEYEPETPERTDTREIPDDGTPRFFAVIRDGEVIPVDNNGDTSS